MTTLTIRNLDEHTKEQLRIQAARHGRSMEEEARTILREAIEAIEDPQRLEALHERAIRSESLEAFAQKL